MLRAAEQGEGMQPKVGVLIISLLRSFADEIV